MITHFKKGLKIILSLSLLTGCSTQVPVENEDVLLKEKISQLVQAERGNFSPSQIDEYPLGSVLSGGGSHPADNSVLGWRSLINQYQQSSSIPILYGVDAVHGHNNLLGATIFPHNIGLGATHDVDLLRRIGIATGKEVSATGVHWNFAPTLAVAQDIRWGRTYESYSEDPNVVSSLGLAYIQGLQSTGIAATAKHFLADGATVYGTGSNNYLLDQGDAQLDEETLRNIHLYPYQAAINEGNVLTVMVSFSSVNGEKMHQSRYWITDVLKGELEFQGLVISDWEAIHQLKGSLYQQVVASINAGIDMLMQPNDYKAVVDTMFRAVKNKDISMDRIEDAYQRVMYVKKQLGLLDRNQKWADESIVFSSEHKALAREAVAKSLVLLKNEKQTLPLEKSSKILMIGPGIDNAGLASGGWTYTWQGETTGKNLSQTTTLKTAFENVAEANGGWITTDKNRINEVDVVLLVLAELPYAEGLGDASDLSLTGSMMHPDNKAAIKFVKSSSKPIVTILIAGRPRLIYEELKDWDSFVMAWLFGSESSGVSDVLYGDVEFTGTLPFTWPKNSNTNTTSSQNDQRDLNNIHFDIGFGLKLK